MGAAVKVLWGGKCWDATVVKVDGPMHWITYPGWAHYWDEWVADEIRSCYNCRARRWTAASFVCLRGFL